MQRILLAIGGAAAFCAIGTLFLQLAIARGLPVDELVLITAIATLMLSIAATALAYRALNRSNEVASELERVSRSMEAAIKDVSARGDRDAAVLGDLSTNLKRRFDALERTGAPAKDKDHNAAASVSHGPSKRGKHLPNKDEKGGGDFLDQSGIEVALRRAAASDHANLSLQPIIAAGRGAAGGFEVHVHIQPEAGKPADIRRVPGTLADFNRAAFEKLVVLSAAEVARKRPDDVNEKVPLHVAVSDALLTDELEFLAVLDLFRLHPALARSIMISLPASLVESGELAAPLETLKMLDVGLAIENWSGTEEDLDTIREAGCSIVKLSAARLLGQATVGKGDPTAGQMIEMIAKAGIEIVATDVASDEDAVSLIEIGVDLMTGERLSPPRPVKNDRQGQLSA